MWNELLACPTESEWFTSAAYNKNHVKGKTKSSHLTKCIFIGSYKGPIVILDVFAQWIRIKAMKYYTSL